jgi:hypothetical protein
MPSASPGYADEASGFADSGPESQDEIERGMFSA